MNENNTNNPEWTPEPFPEPRTIPTGWASGFEAARPQNLIVKAASEAEEWQPEAFSEPRTFPSGWNFAPNK